MLLFLDQDTAANGPTNAGVFLQGASVWLVTVDLAATGTFTLEVLGDSGDWIAMPNTSTTSADTVYTVNLQGVFVRGVLSGVLGTPQCTAHITPIS